MSSPLDETPPDLEAVEGTGFSPYMEDQQREGALAPEGAPAFASEPGAPGPDSGTWETSELAPFALSGHDFSRAESAEEEEEGASAPEAEGTGFSPYIDPIPEEGASAPEATPPLTQPAPDSMLFESFGTPEPPRAPRIPHLGHFFILVLLLGLGSIAAMAALPLALHFHLFGISNAAQATTDIHYTLLSEVVMYFFAFAGCLLIFPPLWNRGFFNGISWRRQRARRRGLILVGAAFLCFLLAIVNGLLMPGPPDAPIDRVFRVPGAAWLLFGFGVTVAPFFEEIIFRGFLLPALCTACDWLSEKVSGNSPRPLDNEGQPQWSMAAMIAGSILTSLPFAGMHASQTGYSLGPFVLLLAVSLVLCWVRLGARSLAASVVVHACYNFMLFSLMLLGSGGFKHLEKM